MKSFERQLRSRRYEGSLTEEQEWFEAHARKDVSTQCFLAATTNRLLWSAFCLVSLASQQFSHTVAKGNNSSNMLLALLWSFSCTLKEKKYKNAVQAGLTGQIPSATVQSLKTTQLCSVGCWRGWYRALKELRLSESVGKEEKKDCSLPKCNFAKKGHCWAKRDIHAQQTCPRKKKKKIDSKPKKKDVHLSLHNQDEIIRFHALAL